MRYREIWAEEARGRGEPAPPPGEGPPPDPASGGRGHRQAPPPARAWRRRAAVKVLLQEATACAVSGEPGPGPRGDSGGTEPQGIRDVEYQSVYCSLRSDGDNITVIVELSLSNAHQFLKSGSALLVPGKITFNKELYLGLEEENHNAEITLIFLKDEVFDPLPTIIRSCFGGLFMLVFIILLLWKCGFFKRKYRAMMEQEETS